MENHWFLIAIVYIDFYQRFMRRILKEKLFTYLQRSYNYAIVLLYTLRWYYPQQVDVQQDKYYATTICSIPTMDESYHATWRYAGPKKRSCRETGERH